MFAYAAGDRLGLHAIAVCGRSAGLYWWRHLSDALAIVRQSSSTRASASSPVLPRRSQSPFPFHPYHRTGRRPCGLRRAHRRFGRGWRPVRGGRAERSGRGSRDGGNPLLSAVWRRARGGFRRTGHVVRFMGRPIKPPMPTLRKSRSFAWMSVQRLLPGHSPLYSRPGWGQCTSE